MLQIVADNLACHSDRSLLF